MNDCLGNGRRTSLSMPNGTTTSYSYDSLSRLLQIQTLKPNLEVINNNTYTYDNVGNKLSKQDTVGTHNYTYDNTYQLTQATHPPQAGQPNEVFAYDAVGNRNNTTVDAANKLLQDPNATYQYDANGNRYVKTQSDGTVVYYSYDYEGRLTRVETQKPGLTTIAVYKYDPLGSRFEKNVDGVVTRYLYSNEGLIAEYDINNNLKKSYGWMPNGIWGTDPLYMTENNQTYFYHNDALGTPQKMTNASGNVVWSATYTSFGEATVDAGSTITSNLRFAGQYFDQETGINYNLFRVYDPKTGTYISKDPISFAAGDVNLYRYVFNSPINLTDPYGLFFSTKGYVGMIVMFVGGALRNVPVVIIGAAITIWDVVDSLREANKKGLELGEQYKNLRKPEEDKIKELLEEEYPSSKNKNNPQECDNGNKN